MTTPNPALDFAAIREQCPKAFRLLLHWFGPTVPGCIASYAHASHYLDTHPRDLYDFFDGQGVVVSAIRDFGMNRWDWYVESQLAVVDAHGIQYTRAEAETAAFGAAFVRLEEKLKQEKG